MRSKTKAGLSVISIICLLSTIFIAMSITGCNEPTPITSTPTVKWDDTRSFTELLSNSDYFYKSVVSTEKMGSRDGSDNLLIILGVEKEFRSADVNAIQEFVDTGGWVIIADDGTNANRISSIWNINYQGSMVLTDSGGFDKNYSFVKGEGNIDGSSYDLLFNTPTGFNQIGDGEVIANYPYSREDVIAEPNVLAVYDNNSDYIFDKNDEYAQECPFAVRIEDGTGGLVFISDSGIFCDQVFSKLDNRAFITKLISSLITDEGTIYFDESHQTSLTSGHKSQPA